MSDIPRDISRRESYSVGHSCRTLGLLQTRRAKYCAGFLLPHLSDGMTILDCGCGPGSITADFAELLPQGRIVGIDREPKAIQSAAALARERRTQNLTFLVADVYELPFAEHSFDAVFAHSLLMHLSRPLEALGELRRVLRHGGVAGIADPDFGGRVLHPVSPLLERFQDFYLRALATQGTRLHYARSQRAMLLAAGFSRTEAHSFSVSFGNEKATSLIAGTWEEFLSSNLFREEADRSGWPDDSMLEALREELRSWGDRPDAFLALLCCGTVAWL